MHRMSEAQAGLYTFENHKVCFYSSRADIFNIFKNYQKSQILAISARVQMKFK